MSIHSRQMICALITIGLVMGHLINPSQAAVANPEFGRLLYTECEGCHAVGRNMVGPKLCGLIGRPAASIADFGYSEAMRGSGLVWDAKTLDEYLAAPLEKVPEARMEYAGFPDPADRFELIEYLKVLTDPRKCK